MPAIQFSGLASGLDTDSIIEAMLSVERIPNVRREQENKILESKSQILDQLTSALSDLSSKAKALESTQDFLSFTGSSSDDNTAKLAVSGGATRGSYELEVTQLASSQRNYSNELTSANDAVFPTGADQELTISVGGEETTISVKAGDSLVDIAGMINSSQSGVSAGIFKGANGYRLQLAGNKSGVEHAVTYSGGFADLLGINDNLAAEAKDATALLDGFEISSSDNTFGEVMPGVSLQVFKVHEEGDPPLTLEVSPNEEAVKSKVEDFMSSFNAVIDIVQAQKGEGKGRETLSGDSTVRMIESRLRQAISGSSSKLTGSDGGQLTLAGILRSDSFTGKLSFDVDDIDGNKFDKLLSEDFEGAARHFTGHADPDDPSQKVAGLSDRIMLMVKDLTGISAFSSKGSDSAGEGEEASSSSSSPGGSADSDSIIGVRQKGLASQMKDNRDRITAHERYLESYENQLRMQYAALEEMMSQLKAQGNYLGQIG